MSNYFLCYNLVNKGVIMKSKRVYIIILFIIVLLCSLLLLNQNKISNIKEGTFTFIPSMESETKEGKYYYSDDYFTKLSGNDINPHLRTMAMNIVLATGKSYDKKDKSSYIKDLLNKIDFEEIKVYDYVENNPNSIGTVIAHKSIKDYDVLIVSIRGTRYDIEWESNFIANETGNIKGFEDASQKVISRIKEYIDEKNLNKPIKILVTGYSRGGAVANLTGVYLNEHQEEFNIKSEKNIYVYTFEAPNSSSSNKIYKNIHNVVNKNDIFIYIYPNKWGLNNNGVIEELNDNDILINTYSLNIFNKDDKIVKEKEIKINEFLEDTINWLADDDLINRKIYTKTVEKYLPKLIDIVYNESNNEKSIIDFLSNEFANEVIKEQEDIIQHLFDNEAKDIFNNKISRWIEDARNNSKDKISNEKYTFIKEMLTDKNNIELVLKILLKSLTEEPSTYHISTLLSNLDLLFKQHYPEVNYELIKKEDSYY